MKPDGSWQGAGVGNHSGPQDGRECSGEVGFARAEAGLGLPDALARLLQCGRDLARRLPPGRSAEGAAALLRLESLMLEPTSTDAPSLRAGPVEGDDGYLVTDRLGVVLEANEAAAALLRTRREFL